MRKEAKDLGHMRAKEDRAGLVGKDMLSAVVEGQKAKVRPPPPTAAHRRPSPPIAKVGARSAIDREEALILIV